MTVKIDNWKAKTDCLRSEISRMENFLEAAKDEREQLLEENKRLGDALNTTQDKYLNTLKKLNVVQVEVLKAQEGLTQELDHQRWQEAWHQRMGYPQL